MASAQSGSELETALTQQLQGLSRTLAQATSAGGTPVVYLGLDANNKLQTGVPSSSGGGTTTTSACAPDVWLDEAGNMSNAVAAINALGRPGVIGVKPQTVLSGTSTVVPTQDILIMGCDEQRSIIDGSNGTQNLIQVSGTKLTMRSVTVRNYARDAVNIVATAGNTTTDIQPTSIDAKFCVFRNCGSGSNGTSYNTRYGAIGGARSSSGGNVGAIQDIAIEHCRFHDCHMGINIRSNLMQRIAIRFNAFYDIAQNACYLGDDPTTNYDLHGYWDISHNLFKTVRGDIAFPETHAIQALGAHHVTIMGNQIDTVLNEDRAAGTEGIYTKCGFFNISNNILHNAGYHEGAIAVKRPASDGPLYYWGDPSIIQGNIITFSPIAGVGFSSRGIKTNASHNIQVLNNLVVGATDVAYRFDATANLLFKGNTARNASGDGFISNSVPFNGSGSAPVEFPMTGNINTIIDGNFFYELGGNGVQFEHNPSGGLTSLAEGISVCRNSFDRVSGINTFLRCGGAATEMRVVEVSGNRYTNGGTGVQFSGAINDCLYDGNSFRAMTTSESGTGNVVNLLSSNNRIVP